METEPTNSEDARGRKRRETRERIVQTALELFITSGYDATTVDALASAAGLSRRNFFRYFKSKEDVLLAWEGAGVAQALEPAMLEEATSRTPLDAAQNCLVRLAARYETPDSVAVDRLLRSTQSLRNRKDAVFVDMERSLYRAMVKMWPAPKQQDMLRVAAMIAIGALRLSLEDWRAANAERPLDFYIRRTFGLLPRLGM